MEEGLCATFLLGSNLNSTKAWRCDTGQAQGFPEPYYIILLYYKHKDLPNKLFNKCAHAAELRTPRLWLTKGTLPVLLYNEAQKSLEYYSYYSMVLKNKLSDGFYMHTLVWRVQWKHNFCRQGLQVKAATWEYYIFPTFCTSHGPNKNDFHQRHISSNNKNIFIVVIILCCLQDQLHMKGYVKFSTRPHYWRASSKHLQWPKPVAWRDTTQL